MISISSLEGCSPDVLHAAREAAFSDYPAQWTATQYERLLRRRGYAADLSFGAFDGPDLLSFTLNGTGTFNGLKTVYDCGTGTIPTARGQRLPERIFKSMLPLLQQHGMQQYLLEVLTENESAQRIYRSLGFRTRRELNFFIASGGVMSSRRVAAIDVLLQQCAIAAIAGWKKIWDFQPSWQNTMDALLRQPELFTAVAAFHKGEAIGYGIIERERGDVPQLAVHPEYRRKGVGSAILHALQEFNQAGELRFINADARFPGFAAFLASQGIHRSGSQLEMILPL